MASQPRWGSRQDDQVWIKENSLNKTIFCVSSLKNILSDLPLVTSYGKPEDIKSEMGKNGLIGLHINLLQCRRCCRLQTNVLFTTADSNWKETVRKFFFFFFLKHQKNQKVNTSKIAFGACENSNYSLKYLSRCLLKTNSHRVELAG